MPTYEYRCKACGHHLEVVQSFTEDALTECPECAGPLRKLFGSVGISFKGSGFYKTDSRGGAAKTVKADSGAPSESPASSTSEGGGSGGSSSGSSGGSESSSSTSAAPAPTSP